MQAALGMGDCFGEGEQINGASLIGLCGGEEDVKGGKASAPSDDGLRVAVRAAMAAGQCLEASEQINQGGSGAAAAAGDKKSLGLVLLSDLATNPFASEVRTYVELGLWQKISRATRRAIKRVRGETAHVEVAFKDVYMGRLTEVFGADIDRLRGAEDDDEPFDERCMELVVEALQSGMDMFDAEEKKVLVQLEK